MCCCVVLCVSVVVSQCSDIYIFLQIQNRRAEQLPAGQRDGGREPILKWLSTTPVVQCPGESIFEWSQGWI